MNVPLSAVYSNLRNDPMSFLLLLDVSLRVCQAQHQFPQLLLLLLLLTYELPLLQILAH